MSGHGEIVGSFDARVLRWIQEHHRAEAEVIEQVSPRGTDWDGSTEQGFYSTFAVDIAYGYSDQTGEYRRAWITVEGNDMESLWNAVVDPSGHQGSSDA